MSRREMPMENGVRLEFKPQDCWVGVYWHSNGPMLDVWICLLPMLPLHIRRFRIRPLPPPMELSDEEWQEFSDALDVTCDESRFCPKCEKYRPVDRQDNCRECWSPT